MSRHSVRLWPNLGVLTLALSLVGCGPTVPPAQIPSEPTPPQPEVRPVRDSGEAVVPRAFTSGVQPAPLNLRSDAPPPQAQPQGNVLSQPGQPALSINDLQGALPQKIPEAMAGSMLQALNKGPIADVRAAGLPNGLGYGGNGYGGNGLNPPGPVGGPGYGGPGYGGPGPVGGNGYGGPGLNPPGPVGGPGYGGPGSADGLGYGALPYLLDYGVYPNLLYYPFQAVWVPYILVDHFYYPYVYQPFFDPLFAGYCYYPLFVFNAGFYYPYYFYSSSYYFGYLDWEYNWFGFRDDFGDFDWNDLGHGNWRRFNDNDFDDWRDGKFHNKRDRDDWKRKDPPHKKRNGDDRDGSHDRQSDRLSNGGQGGDRRERAQRSEGQRVEGSDRREQTQRSEGQRVEGGDRRERTQRSEGQRVESKQHKERIGGERSSNKVNRQQKKEGRKGNGNRRLQSEEEEAQEQLD